MVFLNWPARTCLQAELRRANGAFLRCAGFARVRRDGAAPLIGSSRAIRQVRVRIERVAATDFTIEGRFGPQPHPNFIG
jgi:DNA-binding NtrC family response regulator